MRQHTYVDWVKAVATKGGEKVSKEKKNLDVCEELENGELENIPTLELAS